jgi:hypothetical protein
MRFGWMLQESWLQGKAALAVAILGNLMVGRQQVDGKCRIMIIEMINKRKFWLWALEPKLWEVAERNFGCRLKPRGQR